MTPEQQKLVQDSLKKALKNRDDFGEFFYACLFDIDPELKKLFRTNIEEQAHRFLGMVSMAVVSLKELDKITPEFENLGRHHHGYELKAGHYESFGRALIWTLDHTLGGDFTDDTRKAWQAWYELVAQTMAGAAGRAA